MMDNQAALGPTYLAHSESPMSEWTCMAKKASQHRIKQSTISTWQKLNVLNTPGELASPVILNERHHAGNRFRDGGHQKSKSTTSLKLYRFMISDVLLISPNSNPKSKSEQIHSRTLKINS